MKTVISLIVIYAIGFLMWVGFYFGMKRGYTKGVTDTHNYIMYFAEQKETV